MESPHALPRCSANANGSLALRWAAENGHLEVVKYLVELERMMSPHSVNAAIYRALEGATAGGHPKVVEYLKNCLNPTVEGLHLDK